MPKALRLVLAVVAGVVLWGLIWNLGTLAAQSALPGLVVPGQPIAHVGVLVGFIVYSVGVSIAAGYLTAVVAAERWRAAVLALGVVNLAIGVAVELSYWDWMPAWYHLVFLALVVPATLYGGRLRGLRRRARAEPAPA